ncbi:MAG: hypothetical protein PHO54_00810 [Candidatus Peribacteraceae bacterium]|nr:hypothetical protein [Candidatus Peribacteraceae bacterium]
MRHTSFAPGKIIVSGEYAVVFGEPGLALPAPLGIRATFVEDAKKDHLDIKWLGIKGNAEWDLYLRRITGLLEQGRSPFRGTLTVMNQLPLQKGLGSSTALVIAVSRVLIGKGKEAEALAVENELNTGHSGIDFAVIWQSCPIYFRKGQTPIPLKEKILDPRHAVLIDTGKPKETTPELVAMVKEKADDPRIRQAIKTIGQCTERLRKGEDIRTVFRDHHRAQAALGVVPKAIQTMIADIERLGGAAKVTGAGGKTGGGGMVLAIHKNPDLITPVVRRNGYALLPLSAALNP